MRLFGKVDGVIDRYDRAQWLSVPFDLAFAVPPSVIAKTLTLLTRSALLTLDKRSVALTLADRSTALTLDTR